MAIRKIIKIDEEKCNGCGLCIPNCAEGALQIIDGKAKLMSEKFCDGLGACLGHCPQDAIKIIEREAEDFDEKAVELHLQKDTNGKAIFYECPSSRPIQFRFLNVENESIKRKSSQSCLLQWPVQLKLVPINAPYFQDANLIITADCVPFAYSNFHEDFLRGRAVAVGCPKLDDIQYYKEKLTEIFKTNSIKEVTIVYMEVPCCFGLVMAVEEAIRISGRNIPIKKFKIGIRGELKKEIDIEAPINLFPPANTSL